MTTKRLTENLTKIEQDVTGGISLSTNQLGVVPKTRSVDMKTMKECVEALKCRTGKAAGTTKDGTYWLAGDEVLIHSCGGDGIGQSAPDVDYYFALRHYRTGEVRAVVRRYVWHQNSGDKNDYRKVPVMECSNVEQVVVELKKGLDFDGYDDATVYSDGKYDGLKDFLLSIGMLESEPGPDED